MFELARPTIDWTALAAGMGMEAASVSNNEDFAERFARAVADPGPTLIEVRLHSAKS